MHAFSYTSFFSMIVEVNFTVTRFPREISLMGLLQAARNVSLIPFTYPMKWKLYHSLLVDKWIHFLWLFALPYSLMMLRHNLSLMIRKHQPERPDLYTFPNATGWVDSCGAVENKVKSPLDSNMVHHGAVPPPPLCRLNSFFFEVKN